MRARTIEQTRLINARQLAKKSGGTTAMAIFLGKAQPQWQNTIGKTPKKNIGSDVAREIEVAYSLDEGWMDMPWDMLANAGGNMAVEGSKEPASSALSAIRLRGDIQALQWISGAIFNALVVAQPHSAEMIVAALNSPEIPDGYRETGPIEALLSGLASSPDAAKGRHGPKRRGSGPSGRRSGPSKM